VERGMWANGPRKEPLVFAGNPDHVNRVTLGGRFRFGTVIILSMGRRIARRLCNCVTYWQFRDVGGRGGGTKMRSTECHFLFNIVPSHKLYILFKQLLFCTSFHWYLSQYTIHLQCFKKTYTLFLYEVV